ncbi:MAG: hypothetical protein ACI83P_001360 [Janthinobacterium sp.]
MVLVLVPVLVQGLLADNGLQSAHATAWCA